MWDGREEDGVGEGLVGVFDSWFSWESLRREVWEKARLAYLDIGRCLTELLLGKDVGVVGYLLFVA